MNLLYVADNGFSFCDGKFYCETTSKINIEQYGKYFDVVHIIARKSEKHDGMFEICNKSKVKLIKKNDFISLYKAMKKFAADYDVVLMRNGINGCMAGIFARILKKQTIAYCGADPKTFQYAKKGFIRKYIIAHVWEMLEKQKMAKSDYAQYCTQYLFNKYPTIHRFLICSNVDVVIDNSNYQERIRKLEKPKKKIIVGMIGRIDENKGVRTIIRSLLLLDDNYTFELIGEGSTEDFEEEIDKLGVKGKIKFLGYCPDRGALKEWLKRIDIYIQPSISEGLPRATIEAMSFACPCVATNVAGLPDLLDEKYLIEPRDHVALAKKIYWLTRNVEAAKEAACKNFEKSKEFRRELRDKKMSAFFDEIKMNISCMER